VVSLLGAFEAFFFVVASVNWVARPVMWKRRVECDLRQREKKRKGLVSLIACIDYLTYLL
jgi:hypothetical protein